MDDGDSIERTAPGEIANASASGTPQPLTASSAGVESHGSNVKKEDELDSSTGTKCEVERWLLQHDLLSCVEPLVRMNGYEDLIDLKAFVERNGEDFKTAVPQAGRREKLRRLFSELRITAVEEEPSPSPLSTSSHAIAGSHGPFSSPIPPAHTATNSSISTPMLARQVSKSALDNEESFSSSTNGVSNTRMSLGVSSQTFSSRNLRSPSPQPVTSYVERGKVRSESFGGTSPPALRYTATCCSHEEVVSWKICVVGGPNAGKSSMIRRLVDNQFSPTIPTTRGVEFHQKRMIVEETTIEALLWDIQGQRAADLLRPTLTGTKGCIFMYDCQRRESLDMALQLKKAVADKLQLGQGFAEGLLPSILVAAKSDLPEDTHIIPRSAKARAEALCNEHHFMHHMYCSAKTGMGVDDILHQLLECIWKTAPLTPKAHREASPLVDIRPAPKIKRPAKKKSTLTCTTA